MCIFCFKAKFGDGRLPGALSRCSSLGSVATTTTSSIEFDSPTASLPTSPRLNKGWDRTCFIITVNSAVSHSQYWQTVNWSLHWVRELQQWQMVSFGLTMKSFLQLCSQCRKLFTFIYFFYLCYIEVSKETKFVKS